MGAEEKTLGKLHELLAQHFIKALEAYENPTPAQEGQDFEEVLMVGLSPSLLGVMVKFLKDNEITCNPEEIGNSAKRLKAKLDARNKVGNVEHVDFA